MPKFIMTVEGSFRCNTTVEVEAETEEAAREIAAEEAISFEPVSAWDYTYEEYKVVASQPILPDPDPEK